nr:transcriptional regulator [Arthrobacter stackebrandtii]
MVLHAVCLLGFADSRAVAERAGTSHGTAVQVLGRAERAGWIQHFTFADLAGWSLTDPGKSENERQLAAERGTVDRENTIPAIYGGFLPLNARLLRAVTDWQIKPTGADRFGTNNHDDPEWDRGILDELSALGSELAPLAGRLSALLMRFDGYVARYESALEKGRNGQHNWIDTTTVDSCHRVWFQLHEDLIATLGISRHEEA